MARRRLLASGRNVGMKRILKWIISNRLDWKRERDSSVARGEGVGVCVRACVSACVRLEMQLGARVICIVLTVPFRSPWLLFIGHFLRLRVTSIIDKLDLDVYGNGHILAATLVFSLGSRVFNIISALRPKFPWNSSLFFKLPLSYSYAWNPHRCYRCSFEPLM